MSCTRETHPVAFTILDQIGGMRRLALMTGAKDFAADEQGVQFSVGRGAKESINKVVIKLNEWDTYDVQFWRLRKRALDCKIVVEHKGLEGVYAEDLQRVFTEATGFVLSLG